MNRSSLFTALRAAIEPLGYSFETGDPAAAMTLKENPKKKILNFLAAKLLNLDPDILYDYAKQEIKKKFKFRFLFMLPLILLVLSGGFFAYDSTRTV